MPKQLSIRLCALAIALGLFAFAWFTISARPWQAETATTVDPRLVALKERERSLRHEAEDVRRLVRERWADYRRALKQRREAIAAAERRHRRELRRAKLAAARPPRIVTVSVSAPRVQIVSLPPVTKSTSS